MASYAEWRVAYAKQARADLQARERLIERPALPDCQQLHFLQMACEKICKAYLCGQGTDPQSLQASHAYVAGVLPVIARQQLSAQLGHSARDRSWVIRAIRKLARKIELLAPSVTAGGVQPDNCEYPWVAADGSVRVPAEHNFQFDLLYEPAGRHLMKILYTAVDELAGSAQPQRGS